MDGLCKLELRKNDKIKMNFMKKPFISEGLFRCTGGETRTLTPCGTRS